MVVIEDLDLESADTEATLTGSKFDSRALVGMDAIEVAQLMCIRTPE
jgi:hypothetical protein